MWYKYFQVLRSSDKPLWLRGYELDTVTDQQFCQVQQQLRRSVGRLQALRSCSRHAALGGAWSHHPASVCLGKSPQHYPGIFFVAAFKERKHESQKRICLKVVGHSSILRYKWIRLPTLPSNLGRNPVELIICLSNALQGFLITGNANDADKTKM